MSALPPYLRAKATKLPEGHDDTLDPPEPPTDAARRMLAPTTWPTVSRARGPLGPPDAPAGPPGTDPLRRGLAPFSWPQSHISDYVGDLDPDLALWPGILLTRWPFTGPPTSGVWPLGWLGVDNTATLWVCTVGGQPGTWVAIGGQGGQGIAGMFNVRNYGATGNGSTDDTAAFLAAGAALNAAGGGIRYVPPGNYRCTGQLTYYPNEWLLGCGTASEIHLTTDLYAGSAPNFYPPPFLVPAAGIGTGAEARISMLHIQGPGSFRGYGLTPSRTNGIQSANGCAYDDLYIAGFFAGIENITNHETYENIYSTVNYYGIDFSDELTSGANQSFYSCKLVGNTMASVHISPYNGLLNTSWHQVHFGFGPLGLYRTDPFDTVTGWDANNNPIYTPATAKYLNFGINQSGFREPAFEQIGNVAILDTSTGTIQAASNTIAASSFENLFYTGGSSYQSTLAPLNTPDTQLGWFAVVRVVDTMTRFRMSPIPVGSIGSVKQSGGGMTIETGSSAMPANFFGTDPDWSSPAQAMRVDIAGIQCWSARLIANRGPINVGDCLQLDPSAGGAVLRAAGTLPCYGVAMTPIPASTVGTTILVAVRGTVTINQTGAVAINAGAPLYLSSTTPYLVDQTSNTKPVVGIAVNAPGAGSTTVQAILNPIPA